MRPLVLAGILAALAGCSLPYEGTSFKAVPKFESSKESAEHGHEGGAHEEAAVAPSADAPKLSTSSAFPTTAQPSGKPAAPSTGE